MAEKITVMTTAFDFSLEALDFKERLWRRLQTDKPTPALQPLEDDDLEWINAAGMMNCGKEKDPFQ